MGKKYKEASVQTKWNRDTIREAIQTCETRSEFKRRYGQAYLQMRRHGWQELLSALPSRNAPYWTYERASELVSKCSTRFQLRSSYPAAYHAIIKHGWEYAACRNNGWNDILDSLGRTYRPSETITDEDIRAALAQCKTRTEFNIRFRSESYAAKKRGIYNDLVKHLPKQTGKRVKKK